MGNQSSHLTLYSAQAEPVYQAILRDGACYSRPEYVQSKYGESAHIFLTAYRWFVEQFPRYVPRPEGAQFPYWAFADLWSVDTSGPGRVLTLEVPADQAVLFDLYDWNRIVQLGYLGLDREEERRWRRELSLQGLREYDVMSTAFYPQQRQEILDSWQRLFHHHAALLAGDRTGVGGVQAGLWCIRREWVVQVR